MLKHQATLHAEQRPGGRLRSVKWFTSSLMTHEFLLAGMIVCLDLYHTAEAERSGRRNSTDLYDSWSQERRASMMSAIEQSLSIWQELKDNSMEAFKAQGTLGVMVVKLKEHQAMRQAQQAYPATANGTVNSSPYNNTDDANVAPEHSAAMTLGMLSTGGLTPSSANVFNTAGFGGFDANQLQTQPTNSTTASGSTGLTPNWSSNGSEAKDQPLNAPSPFSSLFGNNNSNGMQSMDLPADWVCSRHRGSPFCVMKWLTLH